MAHLLFLTSTPPTVEGGSGTWVGISVLRDAVVALGHRVTLIHGSRETAGNSVQARLLFNFRMRSRLRRLKADALIGFDLDGVFVPRKLFFHVASIKGVLADEAHHEQGSSRYALTLLARLEARHVRRCDRVLTTSRYSAQQIEQHYGTPPEKIVVVPELIDLASWTRALHAAPRIEGPPRVLCVAHLYPRKEIDGLLRAFAQVQELAVLRISGVGPERARLEQLAQDLGISTRVQFLGHLPIEALVAEYLNAAVFALPSTQEGFGIVFLEAMASSLPVIAARAAAIPEVVVENETALLVESHDEEALAENLRRLLLDPALRTAMGNAGRAHVRRYDAPVVAQQFLDALV